MRRNMVVAGLLAMTAGGVLAAGLPRIAPGEWQVHEIGGAGVQKVCVRDATRLVQWRHPGQACTLTPVGGAGAPTTVYYSCGRGGEGQTVLTVENPALVRIQTQGMAGGQPFDLDLEARRTGVCRAG